MHLLLQFPHNPPLSNLNHTLLLGGPTLLSLYSWKIFIYPLSPHFISYTLLNIPSIWLFVVKYILFSHPLKTASDTKWP